MIMRLLLVLVVAQVIAGQTVFEARRSSKAGRFPREDDFLGDEEDSDLFPSNGNSFDFTHILHGLQGMVDRLGERKECGILINIIEHTTHTVRELLSLMNALQKMGVVWQNVNISSIGRCIAQPNVKSGHPAFLFGRSLTR